jgi:hypothetical protein
MVSKITGMKPNSLPFLALKALTCRYASGEHKVVKATFAVYNAFRRVDVRCEATFPGHVRTFFVDGKGCRQVPFSTYKQLYADQVECTLISVTSNSTENVPAVMWEEAYLCSMMRSHQPVPSLPGIKVIPAHPMMNDQALVTLATKYFWEGTNLQSIVFIFPHLSKSCGI